MENIARMSRRVANRRADEIIIATKHCTISNTPVNEIENIVQSGNEAVAL